MAAPGWGALAGKSVLVTGHTGFMGSWLTLWLHRLGSRVTGYALEPPTEPNHFRASRIDELLVGDIRGDVRDQELLSRTVERCAPDVVFHLAAQPLVLWGLEHPRETFEVNVIGTANLCDAVRRLGRACTVVVATSDKCYRNDGQGRAFEEGDALGGHDPYSASKAGEELVVAAYRSSYFEHAGSEQPRVDLTSVRAGNVIGGGDWAADRLVPDAVRALSRDEPLVVRNPGSSRPWQHVLEPLSGYLSVATRDSATVPGPEGEPTWNFGPHPAEEVTAADLATAVVTSWGAGRWTPASQSPQDKEATALRISINKAQTELGWSPRWDWPRATARTIEWYRAFYENPRGSMRDHSMADIEAYENTAPGEA